MVVLFGRTAAARPRARSLCHSKPGTATQAFAAWPDAAGRTGVGPAARRSAAPRTIISNFNQILDNKKLNNSII
jgi:hypothetical protein